MNAKRLKPRAIQQFNQHLVKDNNKVNIRAMNQI